MHAVVIQLFLKHPWIRLFQFYIYLQNVWCHIKHNIYLHGNVLTRFKSHQFSGWIWLKEKQSVNKNVTQSQRIFTAVKIETRPIVCMLGIPQLEPFLTLWILMSPPVSGSQPWKNCLFKWSAVLRLLSETQLRLPVNIPWLLRLKCWHKCSACNTLHLI